MRLDRAQEAENQIRWEVQVLTFATMQELLKNHPFDGPKVVFAEACAGLAEQELKAHQITFKQIPTDLLR